MNIGKKRRVLDLGRRKGWVGLEEDDRLGGRIDWEERGKREGKKIKDQKKRRV